MIFSDAVLFAFGLIDVGAVLFLLIYFVGSNNFHVKRIANNNPRLISDHYPLRLRMRLPQRPAMLLKTQLCENQVKIQRNKIKLIIQIISSGLFQK